MFYVERYEKVNQSMQETDTKGIQDEARLGGKKDLLGIVQEIEIWS